MLPEFPAILISSPGVVRHFTPYRGESGGELNSYASLPSSPIRGGELASSMPAADTGRAALSVHHVLSVRHLPPPRWSHRRTEKSGRKRPYVTGDHEMDLEGD